MHCTIPWASSTLCSPEALSRTHFGARRPWACVCTGRKIYRMPCQALRGMARPMCPSTRRHSSWHAVLQEAHPQPQGVASDTEGGGGYALTGRGRPLGWSGMEMPPSSCVGVRSNPLLFAWHAEESQPGGTGKDSVRAWQQWM